MAYDGVQKKTFLPYLRGILPEELRLGSLYINPLDPVDDLASRRWEYMEDEEDQTKYEEAVKKWTRRRPETDEPFSIEFEASKARSLGFSFTEFLNLSGAKTEDSLVKIEGKSGRRVRIKNPEKFLEEEVLKQDGIDKWICQHASITHKSNFGRNKWIAPKIWMVTAVQYVTGGDIHSQGIASNKVGGSAGGDASLAVQSPPGTLKAKVEGSYKSSHGATTDFGHKDERVWAAQFWPMSIEFGPEENAILSAKKKLSLPKAINTCQLQDLPDLFGNGIRDQKVDGPVPKLIGHVVVQDPRHNVVDDDEDEESDSIMIDDAQYVANKIETDWEQFGKYKRWLKDVERGN